MQFGAVQCSEEIEVDEARGVVTRGGQNENTTWEADSQVKSPGNMKFEPETPWACIAPASLGGQALLSSHVDRLNGIRPQCQLHGGKDDPFYLVTSSRCTALCTTGASDPLEHLHTCNNLHKANGDDHSGEVIYM